MRRAMRIFCALLFAFDLEVAAVADPMPALGGEACSVDGLLAEIRKGLSSQSEAYRRYLRNLLRESAVTLPAEQLRAAFSRETHPVVAEQLAAALVARSERGADASGLSTVRERALSERDPIMRQAVVRALRRTSAIENTGDLYARLLRDPSPEVRSEAATNLIEDNKFVYYGHHGPATNAAVMAAATCTDPAVTAKVIGELSLEAASPEATEQVRKLLSSKSFEVRSAAAIALGGAPASESSSARQGLIDMYRDEPDTRVRKALLQGIAELGFSSAIPDLQRLRDIDPNLNSEIDAWILVLGKGLQTWELILREKQRLEMR